MILTIFLEAMWSGGTWGSGKALVPGSGGLGGLTQPSPVSTNFDGVPGALGLGKAVDELTDFIKSLQEVNLEKGPLREIPGGGITRH